MVTEELPSRARTGSPALPTGYAEALREIEAHVVAARSSAARAVNAELLGLYHRIGRVILERQRVEGWGAQVIEHLSRDLRATFPTMQGFSRSNLEYMRRLAVAVEETSFPPQLVGELAWGHVRALLDRTAVGDERRFYAEQAALHGWSRAVLTHQMATDLYRRHGNAPTNFPAVLPAVDSDLAQEITRDAYNLEFLRLEPGFRERELEDALIEQLARFLAELGTGFAWLGRQHRLQVGTHEYFLDLLFFHVELARYIVIELKVGAFAPEHAGKLGFYVTAVDEQLRRPDRHAPTIGILLVADRDDVVVQYALRGVSAPMAISTYTYRELPAEMRPGLPDAEELTRIVGAVIHPTHRPADRGRRPRSSTT